jgi:hypothetical protein
MFSGGRTTWLPRLLIQVTDILLESIGAALDYVGLFIVLGTWVYRGFFAWAFELTCGRVRSAGDNGSTASLLWTRPATRWTGRHCVLVIALGYFVVDKFWLSSGSLAKSTAASKSRNKRSNSDPPLYLSWI